MKLGPKDLATIPHREFAHREGLRGKKFTGVSTDTRSLQGGELFIALRGQKFDGHTFLDDAFARGALAAVVDVSHGGVSSPSRPLLVVEDTLKALADLARLYRRKFDIPVLAVGGSNGKTTTKEMIGRVLGAGLSVLTTEGNLNNQIGVPLTIFRLQKRHEAAVVEIGTNHPGEIAVLCDMLEPTHGLITTIGREHLEFFGDLEGVAQEEGALAASLRGTRQSTLFVNADDPMVIALSRGMKRRVTYGFTARKADVKGTLLGSGSTGCAQIRLSGRRLKKPLEITLAVPGEHNALNALAAATVGLALRISPRKIRKALEEFQPASKRLEVLNLEGVLIFNDTYNANPDSMLAALRTLASARVAGKRIAVLADMRELGDAGPEEHRRIGAAVRELGIDYLLTFGTLARHIHDAAALSTAVHYDQKNILAEYLAELIAPGDAILVKGSRGMTMEDVVTFLEERLRSAVVPFG